MHFINNIVHEKKIGIELSRSSYEDLIEKGNARSIYNKTILNILQDLEIRSPSEAVSASSALFILLLIAAWTFKCEVGEIEDNFIDVFPYDGDIVRML